MSLAEVEMLTVPASIVAETERDLRAAGQEGYEAFVLWSGTLENSLARVHTAHLPRQSSYKTENGLFVRVEGEALHKLNAWLYENREQLLAQVHAHPSRAYHSDTDDAFPIVTAIGGFSIVAPDFARAGLFTKGTAAFRLNEAGWLETPPSQIAVVSDD